MKKILTVSFLVASAVYLLFIIEGILLEKKEYRSDLILAVSHLETINSSLNYEVLRSQSYYQEHYVLIDLKVERFKSALGELEGNFNDEESTSIINELKQRFSNKESLINELFDTLAKVRSSIEVLAYKFIDVKEEIDELAEKNPKIKEDLYQYRRELEYFWLNELIEKTTNKGVNFKSLDHPVCLKCHPFLAKDIKTMLDHLNVLNDYSQQLQEYNERLKRTNVELSINTLFIELEYLINDAEEREIKQKIIIFAAVIALILSVFMVFYFVYKSRQHQRISKTDLLTGFGNRNQLAQYFEQLKNNSNEDTASFGMLFIDLDGFKQVNDVLGHSYGDTVLKAVATKLSLRLEEGQELIRYGGDEFIIILPNIPKKDLEDFGDKLVKSGYFSLQRDLTVSLSIGGVMYPDDAQALDELIIKADQAMYESKQKGKNQFTMAS
ncbi:GGDEF domain-containing protein [Marinomonas algicola]|uniref:GGDEF domain-containing protein n=1 Tax=Marinomonas algicola TaxID=2773454 RepID=UPI00174EC0B4|nr:GGDEF domain-containing protein [Marinomonas algicola]